MVSFQGMACFQGSQKLQNSLRWPSLKWLALPPVHPTAPGQQNIYAEGIFVLRNCYPGDKK